MDLVADVAALLEAAGEATVADFYGLLYDKGELSFDENGDWLYTANGIPDAVEIALLSEVMIHPDCEHAADGGVSSEYVWRSFAANYDTIKRQLGGYDRATTSAAASLLTLGDLGHAFHAVQLVKEAYGVDINLDQWKTGAFRWLGARKDARGGGTNNLGIWTLTTNTLPAGVSTARDSVCSFVQSITGIAPSNNAFLSFEAYPPPQSTGPKSLDSGDCGCWNDDCVTPAIFKVQSAWSSNSGVISASGGVNIPSECSPVDPTSTNGALVQPGRQVTVTADSDWFTKWDAPGTPIDGSYKKKETFTYTGATVTPDLPAAPVRVYYDPIHTHIDADGGGGTVELLDNPAFGYCDVVSTGLDPITLTASPSTYTVSGTVNGQTVTFTYELTGWALADLAHDVELAPTIGTTSPSVLQACVSTAEPRYTLVGASGGPAPVYLTHSPAAAKGGYVMTGGNIGVLTEKVWPSPDGTIVPLTIAYTSWPYPGFTRSIVSIDEEMIQLTWAMDSVSASTTGSADFEQMAELTVDVALAGEGADQSKSLGGGASVKPECVGYATFSPACRYYGPEVPAKGFSSGQPGQEVTIEAHERTGYVFSKWVGSGEATYVPSFPMAPTTGRLDDREHPITAKTIILAMDQARQVKAAFQSARQACDVTGGDRPGENYVSRSNASEALTTFSYKVNEVSQPTKAKVLSQLRKNRVFVYSGHGLENLLNLGWAGTPAQPIALETLTLRIADVVSADLGSPDYAYKFVYLKCCLAGSMASSWVSAFGNQASFVGFTQSPFYGDADKFDKAFWQAVESGITVGGARLLGISATKDANGEGGLDETEVAVIRAEYRLTLCE
jgi:hypothetical protein